MYTLLTIVWDDVVQPLWKVRNDILAIENEKLVEKILWYMKHKHHVLSAYDRKLEQLNVPMLHHIPRHQKWKWVVQRMDIA